MRRILLIITGLIILLGTAASLYLFVKAPENVENNIRSAFASAGFADVSFGASEKKLGAITYTNLKLDADAFSSIDTLIIRYSPFSLLFGGMLESITLKNVELTGELAANNEITLAGWDKNRLKLNGNTLPKTLSLQIENAQLSLLSEKWGGISLSGDFQFQPGKNKTPFQASIKAAQKQLSASAKMEGQINKDGIWNARTELEQGKFEFENFKTSRLAGLMDINGRGLQTPDIIGELQAGGLNIAGLPWKNGAITLEGKMSEPRMILAAKSAGFEGMELGLNVENLRHPDAMSGQIHIDQLSTAFDYLESQDIQLPKRTTLKNLNEFSDINIKFQQQGDLIFNIKNELKNIDIKGKIIKADGNSYQTEFLSTPMTLQGLLGKKNAQGSIILKGNISYKNKPDGKISLEFKDASTSFGALPLSAVNGIVEIDNFKTLSGPVSKPLNCVLTGLKAQEHCKVSFRPRNGKMVLNNLDYKIPGLNLTSAQAPGGSAKTLISVKEVDIKDLLDLFRTKSWKGTGLLTGTLALKEQNGESVIDSLYLQNKGVGILKLTDDRLFNLMDMDELEKETMKLALEDFHYDLLEIKAKGAFPDEVKISVFGKGKNPLLLQGRAFSIDFEVTPDLSPVIARITKNN